MSAHTWLECINPAPTSPDELAQICAKLTDLVYRVVILQGTPNWRAMATQDRADAKKYRAAAKALSNLPEPSASSELVGTLVQNLGIMAAEREGRAEGLAKAGLAPKKKGGALDWARMDTVFGCEYILQHHRLDMTDAATARLALWVWNEAKDFPQDAKQCDMDAWETTVRRARGRNRQESPAP